MPDTSWICDLIEPIKAWKIFSFDGEKLSSLNGWTWSSNTAKALCLRPTCEQSYPHEIPDPLCSCGIYSLKSPVPDCFRLYNVPMAARGRKIGYQVPCEVEIWGGVVRHVDGYRSEWCRATRTYLAADGLGLLEVIGGTKRYVDRFVAGLKSLDIDVRLCRSVEFRAWFEGIPHAVSPGPFADRAGLHVAVPRSMPSWLFRYFDPDGEINAPYDLEVTNLVLPFRSAEWEEAAERLVINFETEEDHATRQGNRQGDGS
jgi:hypothetical protein